MKKSPFVIVITGDPASGKSSAIAALTQKYEQEGFFIGEREEGKCIIRLAAGQMNRDIAEQSQIRKNGLTPFEFLNSYVKSPGNTMRELKSLSPNPNFLSGLTDEALDKSVDAFIDDYMLVHTEMLRSKYEGKDDVIIILDSRIAGLLMKKMGKDCMGIRFSIKPEIAAERLLIRAKESNAEIDIEGLTPEEAYDLALNSTRQRSANERERFIKIYSDDITNQKENAKVDLRNLNNYDLVIDTSGTTIDRETEVLYACIEKAREGKSYDKFWRSTKYLLPGSLQKREIDSTKDPKVVAIKVDDQYYAFYGQEYVGIANHNGYMIEQQTGEESGYPLVPVDLIAKDKQFIFATNSQGNMQGTETDLYVQKNITQELVESFEREYDFKYPTKGVAKLEKSSKKFNKKSISMEK